MANAITMHWKKTRDLEIKTVFSHDNPSNSTEKLMLLNVEALLRAVVDCVQEQQRRDMVKLLSLEVGGQAPTLLQVTSGATAVWHQVLMILY